MGYFLDDDSHWKIQWQPIPGRCCQHDLIKVFLTESSLLPDDQNEKCIRVDYMGNSSKFQSSAASSTSSQSHVSTSNYFQPVNHHRRLAHPCRSTPHLQHLCGKLCPSATFVRQIVFPPPQTEEFFREHDRTVALVIAADWRIPADWLICDIVATATSNRRRWGTR